MYSRKYEFPNLKPTVEYSGLYISKTKSGKLKVIVSFWHHYEIWTKFSIFTCFLQNNKLEILSNFP